MVTSVGLDGPSTCAAIRAGISGTVETRFFDQGGERLLGCPVPLESSPDGPARLSQLATSAVKECLLATGAVRPQDIPLYLCLGEKDRPGRKPDLELILSEEIQKELKVRFHPDSRALSQGKTSIVHALKAAEHAIHDLGIPFCIVAGVDSLLSAATLRAYEDGRRLLTSLNSNGFIPGEAACALLIGPPKKASEADLLCTGLAITTEKVTVHSEEPFRAEGMMEALRRAVEDAGGTFENVVYRITDLNGEQYGFKEAALAIGRAIRKVKQEFDIWHPADSIGDVGAALGPCVLGVALAAARKGYAPGSGVLCHFASDLGERGALVLSAKEAKAG